MVLDLDRRRLLFFGEETMRDMNERRAMLAALGEIWQDFSIGWAYDGTPENAGYVGAELMPYPWNHQLDLKLARKRKAMCHLVSVVDADYAKAIADEPVRRLSAASYLECGTVLDSQRDPVISRSLDEFLGEAVFVVEPVTEHQTRLARQAYVDFGRGSGHPAGLNFGDCLAYALAIDRRERLLWKGSDFGHTGIQSALRG